ncbi:metal ABC transporter ATP-binding protein [Candidatus Gottesmanbacteria bacterium]|nr:metal ABC transporter ATP-binding protein [Candidatus Gottesmanbacteria bacterium]
MANDVLVSIDNVSFRYNGELALDSINFQVKKGEFLGIIGPNGSGKTTLLKIILGLLTPQTGKVTLFGENIKSFKQWSKIGYVPQRVITSFMRFPITVEEAVGMGRINGSRLFDFTSSEDREAIEESLKAVNMGRFKKKLLTQLSGGQQQRVFIARALASNPELLILDEPTVGVDVDSQAKFYQLLRDLNKKMKLTLILVSHDIDVVANEVETIACLNCKLVCHGTPKEVLKSNFIESLYGKGLKFVVHGH